MSARKKKNSRSTITVREPVDNTVTAGKPVGKTDVPEFSLFAAFRDSPFPPPAELEKYEVLSPGVAKQFFDSFIKQTNHRMELEKTVIEGDNKRANIAQHYSFIITLIFIITSAVLFLTGKDLSAIGVGLAGLVPIVVSFINSSIKRKEERDAKRKSIGLD